jgi:hypothetical protein
MHTSDSATVIEFSEKVYPSALSLLPATLLTPGVALVALPFMNVPTSVLLGLGTTVTALALSILGSPTVQLTKDKGSRILRVGKAAIDISFITKAMVIDSSGKRAALGSGLSSLAFVRIQTGVKELVRVDIKDASDPTPYWIFSSRRGLELKKLLEG